jgi:hypothetical protein
MPGVTYMPRNKNTAAPSAKMPVRIPQIEPPRLTPNKVSPANRKNRIINHVDMALGSFISIFSFCE